MSVGIIGLLNKQKLPPPNMTLVEYRPLRSLQRDTSIVIIPADKGRATVVLDRSTYDQKIQTLLSDEDTYRRLSKDPAPALERYMNDLLRSLKKSHASYTSGSIVRQENLLLAISSQLYSRLHSSAGKPLLYGLPKIHNPDVPLWPIT